MFHQFKTESIMSKNNEEVRKEVLGNDSSHGGNSASKTERSDRRGGESLASEVGHKVAEEGGENRTRKPGSQSNSSDQHNNGRGGGK